MCVSGGGSACEFEGRGVKCLYLVVVMIDVLMIVVVDGVRALYLVGDVAGTTAV